jgi:hypothetical protein
MNTNRNVYKSIAGLALVTACLLMIPFIAMQFSDEVVWTLSDFVIMGAMFFGTGLAYLFVTRKSGHAAFKAAVAFALFTGFFMIWSNLAVGIIGSENNAINLLYFGVIGTGVIGAIISRFEPEPLAKVMYIMAALTSVIAITAIVLGMHHLPESSLIEIAGVNGFFMFLFVVSGLLFRYGAQA